MTWVADSVQAGGSHRVDAGRARAGGKGINVARVAHAEGYPVVAVTTSGGAVGAEFAAELRDSGVPHTLVPVAAQTRRSIAVFDESVSDTMIFNERGETPTGPEWTALVAAVTAALDATAGADTGADADAGADAAAGALVISGSMPPGIGEAELQQLMAPAIARGVPVIVDTSGPLLLAAARAGASLLKPNREELAAATGIAEPMAGIAALCALGAGAVLCSLGSEGMLLASATDPAERSGQRARRAKLDTPLHGNPTGAGDAGVAAAATLAAEGVSLGDSRVLRRATAWSAAAVLMPIAGEISPRHEALERELVLDTVTPADLAAPAHHRSTEGAPA
nr:PfkB family carbohydrate kinase [Leucobacter exalbidus]